MKAKKFGWNRFDEEIILFAKYNLISDKSIIYDYWLYYRRKVCSEKELKAIEKIRDRYLAWKEKWILLEESYSNFLKYYSKFK